MSQMSGERERERGNLERLMYTWIFKLCKIDAFSSKSQPKGNNFAKFEGPGILDL